MDVLNWVIDWVSTHMHTDKKNILDKLEQNYIDIGLIDSIGFIIMISEAESNFDIAFDDKCLSDPAIQTLKGFANAIQALKAT